MGVVDLKGKPYNRTASVLTMLIGSFGTFMMATMLLNAMPSIMKDFNVSASSAEWLTNGYMLILGIMIPVSAYFINKFPSQWLFRAALLFFIVGLLISATAQSFNVLLFGRLFAAIGGGLTAPLIQTIMLTIFPKEERGMAMGLNGLVVGVAPAIGPTLSGYLLVHDTWRLLFWSIIPVALLAFGLSFITLRSVIASTNPKLDLWSVVTSTVGFGALLYGFTQVGDWGWTDPRFFAFLIVGLGFIALFVHRQFNLEKPMLNLNVLRSKAYSLSLVLVAINYIAMVGIEMVFTLYIQTVRGESAFHAGLLLFPGAIAVAITTAVSGRLFDKYGVKGLSFAGLSLIIVGGLAMTQLDETSPLFFIMIFYAIRMIGIGLVLMPLTTFGMNALPVDMMSHGTSVNNTVRQVAGSIGTAILMSVVTNVATNRLPAHAMLKAEPLRYKALALLAELDGYHTAFFLLAILVFVGLLLSFRMKKKAEVA